MRLGFRFRDLGVGGLSVYGLLGGCGGLGFRDSRVCGDLCCWVYVPACSHGTPRGALNPKPYTITFHP